MLRPGSTLRVCAALVGLQAAGLAVVTVFLVVELLVATSNDALGAAVLAGLAALAAVGLGAVARGLLRRRRWARSPAVVTNLILLPVGVGLLQGGRWYVGGPLLLWALGVLVLLFAPATAAELDGD